MEEINEELCWRRKAIRLMLKGLRPCDILKRVPRGREWLRKWSKRFTQLGWLGLQDLSRRPATSPQAYSAQAHTVVIRVRAALERRRSACWVRMQCGRRSSVNDCSGQCLR